MFVAKFLTTAKICVYKDVKANRTNKKNSREKKIHFGNPVLNLFNKDNLKNMVKDPKYELFARMKKKERYMNIKPKKQRRIFAYEYVCHQYFVTGMELPKLAICPKIHANVK